MYFVPLDRQAPWPPAAVAAAKQVVYDGLLRAMARDGLNVRDAGVIVDEPLGAGVLHDAASRGLATACAVGLGDVAIAPAAAAADHARSCEANYWRLVTRYNPEGDPLANAQQIAAARAVCDGLDRRGGPRVMCDLMLQPTQRQIIWGIAAYESDILPRLAVRAITQLQDAGVEPDVWVIEALEQRDDYLRLVEAARRQGRDAGILVRAAGHGEAKTREMMAVGLTVPGVIGAVFGRAPFWDPAAQWIGGRMTRSAAVNAVASEFHTWVHRLQAAVLVCLCALAGAGMAAAAPAAAQKGPVQTGPGTLSAARKFLEGRWSLTSFRFFVPGQEPISLDGEGTLVYDDYGNLTLDVRVDDPTARRLDEAGIVIRNGVLSSSGRAVINLQAHTLTFVLPDQPVPGARSGPLGLNRPRHWEVDGSSLVLTTLGDDGKPASISRWEKLP